MTNKKPQEKKLDPLVNKTGARFRSKVAKLSVGKTWLEIEEVRIVVYLLSFLEISYNSPSIEGMDYLKTSSII